MYIVSGYVHVKTVDGRYVGPYCIGVHKYVIAAFFSAMINLYRGPYFKVEVIKQ